MKNLNIKFCWSGFKPSICKGSSITYSLKNIVLIAAATCISCTSLAQDVSGTWNGIIPGIQLRIVFHVEQMETGYSSKMDSPDQKVFGIPATTTQFEPPVLKIMIKNLGIEFEGECNNDKLIGNFKQGNVAFPLELSREPVIKKEIVRPQTPVKPYPYHSEDIVFKNHLDNIDLAGTLTLPSKQGKFAAVVLISGSGPQNRDEELFGHKPFLVLADHLTRNGLAVLRFDDRGVGGSTGDHKTATSIDFARDVQSAIEYLKTRPEINKKKMGLIGHSEGGIIAPIVASKNKDVGFIVLLAGTGLPGDQILLLQSELIQKVSGVPQSEIEKTMSLNKGAYELIKKTPVPELEKELTRYFMNLRQQEPERFNFDDKQLSLIVNSLANPWMKFFISHDPGVVLEKVKCPVFALWGEKDLQVPPKENLASIKNSLKKAGNNKVTLKEFPTLNHLFQECNTGLPAEYAIIEQTFSPVVMEEVVRWIASLK